MGKHSLWETNFTFGDCEILVNEERTMQPEEGCKALLENCVTLGSNFSRGGRGWFVLRPTAPSFELLRCVAWMDRERWSRTPMKPAFCFRFGKFRTRYHWNCNRAEMKENIPFDAFATPDSIFFPFERPYLPNVFRRISMRSVYD